MPLPPTTIRPRLRLAALCTAAFLLASCAVTAPPLVVERGVVLRGVTVVDTRDGSRRAGQAIVIEGDTIRHVVPDARVQVTGSAQVVEGRGRFVVPGYLDMHTHALAAADAPVPHWHLLVAHGVTGIREMSGSAALVQRARQINAESAAHRLVAPEIVQVAGDLFVGLRDAPAAEAFVRRQKEIGADFLKIVGGSREATLAALAEARRIGLPVSGHLTLGVNAVESSDAGWRVIEHVGAGTGLPLDCSSDEAAIRRALLNGEGAKPLPFSPAAILLPMMDRELDAPFYTRIRQSQDAARCEALARRLAAHPTWQVPTLIRLRTMLQASDPVFADPQALAEVDRARRELWQGLARRFAATTSPEALQAFSAYYGTVQRMIPMMKRAGVPMMTGSDLGGIWVVPGRGLHDEFRELAAAGLTPLEVLQMTTLDPARFLGRLDRLGTVEPGRQADLVLLAADPVTDVRHLGAIEGVVLRGQPLSKERLEDMKARVRAAYAAPAPPPAP